MFHNPEFGYVRQSLGVQGAKALPQHTVAQRGTLPQVLPPQATDRRADGQTRSVSITRDVVKIDRRVEGISMRLAVPVSAYQGVVLMLRPDAAGELSYGLHLLHRDGDLSIILDQAQDDCDILADWRLWSRFFRLPALVERRAGVIEQADLTLGALLLGTEAKDRRPARLKRRPRFLQRRKVGNARAASVRFAGEREIIART